MRQTLKALQFIFLGFLLAGSCVACLPSDDVRADAGAPDAPPDRPIRPPPADERHGLRLITIRMPQAFLEEMRADPEADIERPSRVHFDGREYAPVVFQLHGGLARQHPKLSFRLTFPDDDKPVTDLFGGAAEEHRRLVFHASWVDSSFARNKLTFDAVRAAGGLAPRVSHAVVEVNGEFWGLYVVIERIDKIFLRKNGLNRSGDLYKAVGHDAHLGDNANPLAGFSVKSGETANPGVPLAALVDTLQNTPATFEAFDRSVRPVFHLRDYTTFARVHSFAGNRDTYTKNYYLFHDATAPDGGDAARWRMISWDADATWGNNWDGERVSSQAGRRLYGTDRFAERYFGIDDYWDDHVARYSDALDAELSVDVLQRAAADLFARIEEACIVDHDLWQRPTTCSDEAERLRDFIDARHSTMRRLVDSNLADMDDDDSNNDNDDD